MAKRNYRKSSKKIQPAVMKFNFIFSASTSGKESRHIDLSQVASLVNRRFYRQGLNWAVQGFKLVTTANNGSISIHKLPNTWVMSNAWEKGFRAWMKQQREAMQEVASIKPKFLDYKIFMNKDHRTAGSLANLLPHSAATIGQPIQVATPGEWEYSKIYTPSAPTGVPTGPNGFNIMAVGANDFITTNTVSLIQGYANSRGLPDVIDPNAPDDAADTDDNNPENWLSAMFNEGTGQVAEVIDDALADNNQSPYPYEGDGVAVTTMYPGGATQMNSLEIHSQEFVTNSTIGGTTRLAGGNFPCGLIEVSTFDFKPGDGLLLEVTLVPGTHRGYLAEEMTDM